MAVEADTPPPMNTFRRFVWETVVNFAWARAFWGRRLVGGAMGLIGDAIGEATSQMFYARLPGHPQQAVDSLVQSGKDRKLERFRGESVSAFLTRVFDAWDDYEQAGTSIQVLKAINQWGAAGWPVTWDPGGVTLDESGDPFDFSFVVTIADGLISPPWTPEVYGGGHTYGDVGFFYGLADDTDVAMLRYIVRKWKRSSSVGYVKIYYSPTEFATIRV